MHECPEVIFLNKGSPISHQVPWINAEPLEEFIWRMMSVKVTIKNNLDQKVKVTVQGQGPSVKPLNISPKESSTIKTHISYLVVIRRVKDNKFLLGKILEQKPYTGEIIITVNTYRIKHFNNMDGNEWLETALSDIEKQSKAVARWYDGVARMYSLVNKQPLVVPKLSRLGYYQATLDDKLRQLLVEFCSSKSKELKLEENIVDLEPEVNTNEAPVYSLKLQLDSEIAEQLHRFLQPVLEEWAETKVFLKSMEILKFQNGSITRRHVGRVDNETISVTVDLFKGKDAKFKWPLTTIDFNGDEENFDLTSKDVFVQESTLITSRLTPYPGETALVVRVDYTLGAAWTWRYTKTHLTDGVLHEHIAALATSNIQKANHHKIHTLWSRKSGAHKHDEL